jgi:hypothetical protein
MDKAYRHLAFFFLALPPLMILGFWIPYLADIPRFEPSITTTVHIHALLLFTWISMLVIQPFLINRGLFAVHRYVGKMSYLIMPLILLFAGAMLQKEYREHLAAGLDSGTALRAEYLSTAQLLLLGAFYGLAVVSVKKRDGAAHMRYMICIALVLLPAGLARVLGYWCGISQSASQAICLAVIDVALVGLIIFDKRRRLAALPYLIALASYAAVETGWICLGRPV